MKSGARSPNLWSQHGTEVYATSRREEGRRDATACRGTARQRDRATLCGAETACSYGVQKNRMSCRGTARRHLFRRNRAMPLGAEGPRDATACSDATSCGETERRHVVQRDRTTLRRAEEPRDATRCRETRNVTSCRSRPHRSHHSIFSSHMQCTSGVRVWTLGFHRLH